jgi:large subunit ribosomal protein L31
MGVLIPPDGQTPPRRAPWNCPGHGVEEDQRTCRWGEDIMREKIHPKYFEAATVVCSCGTTWTTGSTRERITTDVCYTCHPFFTGEQRIVDTEGQVDRFYKKLEARTQYQAQVAAREASKGSIDQPIVALGLGPRVENPLTAAGLDTVAKVVERLQTGGDDALLAIEGMGRKNVIDLKKRLRARGFLQDEAAAEPDAPAAE